ncbi:SAVED domain-containing protein [Lentzea sp. NPDC058436]|uniref:SAVED domain-containing protein n=1 Tax=Lentzea sp. NPDC058436 TaxID=3346499 RepID=UPI003656BA4A
MGNGTPSATRAVGPRGETRAVPEAVARHVWVRAGGRCTICNRYLMEDSATGQEVPIGQLAHIVGWSTAPGSPRGDHDLPVEERNSAENLMLLCHDQHRVIDHKSLWEVFDVDTLRAMKRDHEERIRRLTGLGHDNRTTVLRVVGNIHGRPVELTSSSVTTALLAKNRFPDWILRGADEFEIDLRAIPGESASSPAYWAAARSHLEDRLRHLCTQVRKESVNHVSVFALARIPVLVLLGTYLDKMLQVDLYPKRREGKPVWGFDELGEPTRFTSHLLRPGNDPARVAVVCSISGSVDIDRLPSDVRDTHSIYELRPDSVLPTPELINTQATLDRFSQARRTLLSTIEVDHPGVTAIPIFPALPPPAAITIGRHLLHAAHPPLHIYDRMPGSPDYIFATSTEF